MLQSIVNDVIGIFNATFLAGDWIALAIAFGSVLIAGLMMQRGGQIGSMTLLALILFAIGGYLRGAFRAASAEGAAGNRFTSQLEASWAQFMSLQAGTLLAYFIAFMVLIMVLFGLKSALSRG